MRRNSSVYLNNPTRLSEVIAAIQVLGKYKLYKLDASEWAIRIDGKADRADRWKSIFYEHPEFFRITNSDEKISLVWRRSSQRLYDVNLNKELTRQEADKLPLHDQNLLSRAPLNPAEIEMLIKIAIDMSSKELEFKKENRWWVAGAVGFVGIIIGALLRG